MKMNHLIGCFYQVSSYVTDFRTCMCTLESVDHFVILQEKITLEFSSLKVPSPPTQTPVSEKKVKSAPKGKPIQLVEVQEMFELEDLNKAWDDNFLPKKFYVWVPNPRRKQRQEQE